MSRRASCRRRRACGQPGRPRINTLSPGTAPSSPTPRNQGERMAQIKTNGPTLLIFAAKTAELRRKPKSLVEPNAAFCRNQFVASLVTGAASSFFGGKGAKALSIPRHEILRLEIGLQRSVFCVILHHFFQRF